jgi:Asp-tRNA(Asn)/Glu-tRNA(Gln) amidotransferase A subunit family amidase
LTAAAAERFSEFGCHVEAVQPGWEDPRQPAATMWYVSYAARLGERYDERPDWFEPSLIEMIEAGRRVSGIEHGRAALARTAFYEQARRFFEHYDLLLTPQMPLGAWPVDQGPREIGGKPTPSMFDRLNFTFPFAEGLPVALQIVGRWHADTLVLQAAAALEQAAPWAQQRPALA